MIAPTVAQNSKNLVRALLMSVRVVARPVGAGKRVSRPSSRFFARQAVPILKQAVPPRSASVARTLSWPAGVSVALPHRSDRLIVYSGSVAQSRRW